MRCKSTVLGEIPESWDSMKLGDIFKLKSGDGLSKANLIEGKYPVYGGNGVTFYHNSFNYSESKLIIGRVGAKCGCIHRTSKKSWITDNALIIDSFLVDNDSKFIEYILNRIDLNQFANKNAQPVISGGKIYPLTIPFPPLPEQQKIAEILSTVDAKIDIINQRISQTQDLKKGLMQRLLTKGIGHTEFKESPLGKIPKSWEVVKVEEVCKLKGGYAFKSSDSCEEGVRWVKIANVGVNKIKWNDESFLPFGFDKIHPDYLLNEDDIILAMTRPILSGKLKIARITKEDSGSLLNQRVGRVEEQENLNKDFAYQYFNSSAFITAMEKELMGTDPPNISSTMFEKLNITLPSLEEQTQIANILSTVDAKLAVLQNKNTQYQALKKCLMQQLLTGKVRVTGLIKETA